MLRTALDPPRAFVQRQIFRVVGGMFVVLRPQPGIGPNLGHVARDVIGEEELHAALPPEFPPWNLVEDVAGEIERAKPAKFAYRTALWAAALERELQEAKLDPREVGVVATTYGIVRTKRGLEYGVVRYLRVRAAFKRGHRPAAVEVGGHVFPIVHRPWLFIPHSGRSAASCWVKPLRGAATGVPAVLTARHAVVPKGAAAGDAVTINATRGDPPGQLVCDDAVMDAALVKVDNIDWTTMKATRISSQMGCKPVLLRARGGDVRAQVTEQLSPRATLFAVPDQPAVVPALCVLSRMLEPGDSGCLGLDLEIAQWTDDPPPPYLMYRGALGMGIGAAAGFALLLEQPRRIWGLEFHVPDEQS